MLSKPSEGPETISSEVELSVWAEILRSENLGRRQLSQHRVYHTQCLPKGGSKPCRTRKHPHGPRGRGSKELTRESLCWGTMGRIRGGKIGMIRIRYSRSSMYIFAYL